MRSCAGWAASTRSSTISSAWPRSGRPSRASPSRPTSSSGSAARPRPSSRRRSRSSRPSATTRCSRRPTRSGPGRRRRDLADDVPAADKRRRLNALLAVQESIGLARNEAWVGRDGGGARRRGARRRGPRSRGEVADGGRGTGRRDSPAGRASTSWSTSPASRRSSGGSCVAHRARRPVRAAQAPSSGRDRRDLLPTPPLIVIGGATATGKTGLALGSPRRLTRRTASAEIISADSRQVYRGLDIGTAKATRGGPGAGPAPRPGPGRSGRAVQRGRLRRPRPRGAAGDRRRDGGVAILAGGTGLYLRAVAQGLDTTQPAERPGRPGAARGRARRRTACRRSWTASWRSRRARRRRSTCQPAPGRAGPRDRRAPGRRAAAGAARLPGPGGAGSAWPSSRSRTPRGSATGRGPVRGGLLDEARGAPRAIRPGPAGLLGHRLPRGLGVLDGGPTLDDGDRRRRPAQRGVRQAPADLVPRASPTSTWLDADRDPTRCRPACRRARAAFRRPAAATILRRCRTRTDRPRRARREGVPRRGRHRRRRRLDRRGLARRARQPGHDRRRRGRRAPSGRTAATSTRTGTSARARPRSSSRPRARPASTS